MASREEAPQVNAGSMADIAFLLLIFFLVTTTIETDAGLDRMLPKLEKEPPPVPPIPQKNILPISINAKGELLLGDELITLKELRSLTKAFLDNGGAAKGDARYCDYCQGERNPKSSDSPAEAVVSLMSNRETTYGVYIAVQNELVAAYNELRNREAQRLYKTDFTLMEAVYLMSETPKSTREELKGKIKHIQDLFPMKLSEAQRN
ncbi:MAG: ExbD/TolR family protein [Flavobacteriaceae bacterium]